MLLNLWTCRNEGTEVPSSPPWAEGPEPFLHRRNKRFPDKNISALCCQMSWCTQHTATKCSECCSPLELLFFMGRLLSWKTSWLAEPQEVKQSITVRPSYSLSLLPPQICLGFFFPIHQDSFLPILVRHRTLQLPVQVKALLAHLLCTVCWLMGQTTPNSTWVQTFYYFTALREASPQKRSLTTWSVYA